MKLKKSVVPIIIVMIILNVLITSKNNLSPVNLKKVIHTNIANAEIILPDSMSFPCPDLKPIPFPDDLQYPKNSEHNMNR